jgi:hypothetical protein
MPARSKKARFVQAHLARDKGAWDYEDEEFTREDWRDDVRGKNTQIGYFDWVIHNLEYPNNPITQTIKTGDSSMTPEQLEVKVKVFIDDIQTNDTSDITQLADDQVFALIAYKFWKDGMDWDNGIPEMADGEDPIIRTREEAIHALKNIFGY